MSFQYSSFNQNKIKDEIIDQCNDILSYNEPSYSYLQPTNQEKPSHAPTFQENKEVIEDTSNVFARIQQATLASDPTESGCEIPLLGLRNVFPVDGVFEQIGDVSEEVLNAGFGFAQTSSEYPVSMLHGNKEASAEQIENLLNDEEAQELYGVNLTEQAAQWWKNNSENMLLNYDDLTLLQQGYQQQPQYSMFLSPNLLMNDDKKPMSNNWMAPTSEEELLDRCRMAADTSTGLKYLGEAAEKLLQSSTSGRGRGRGRRGGTSANNEGRFQCSECGLRCARKYTLDTHMRIHTGSKPFKCHVCGIGFRQSGTRANHIRAVHSKERPFECVYCGKRFAHKSSITVHIRIHTKEKPHQCPVCDRRFTDRATCSKHQTTHSGARPYKCTVCTKAFSQKSNLKRHFQNFHMNDNDC